MKLYLFGHDTQNGTKQRVDTNLRRFLCVIRVVVGDQLPFEIIIIENFIANIFRRIKNV